MQSPGQGWAEGSWCRGREEAARIEAPVCIPRLALETPDRREADVVSLTHTLIHTKVLIEVIEHRGEGLKTLTEGAEVTGDWRH